MTAEQQLERSVLEGKERDELSAIAQAMSLKTTTRTKKADIIDRILDATGVTNNGESNGSSNGTSNGDTASGASNGTKAARRPRAAAAAVIEAEAPAVTEAVSDDTPAPSTPSDTGPAVFVEPPELSDGNDATRPQHNGQSAPTHQPQNRTRTNNQGQPNQNNRNSQSNTNQNSHNPNNNPNNNNQGDGGDLGNRRGRRRRGRERGVGGELQGGGGQEQPYSGESTSPSARRAALLYARATTSKVRAARRRTMRSILPFFASTPCPGSIPKKRATVHVSKI
jgi:transcription termination factor Rho